MIKNVIRGKRSGCSQRDLSFASPDPSKAIDTIEFFAARLLGCSWIRKTKQLVAKGKEAGNRRWEISTRLHITAKTSMKASSLSVCF